MKSSISQLLQVSRFCLGINLQNRHQNHSSTDKSLLGLVFAMANFNRDTFSLSLSTQRGQWCVLSVQQYSFCNISSCQKDKNHRHAKKMRRHDWSERSFADHVLGITMVALLGPPLDGGGTTHTFTPNIFAVALFCSYFAITPTFSCPIQSLAYFDVKRKLQSSSTYLEVLYFYYRCPGSKNVITFYQVDQRIPFYTQAHVLQIIQSREVKETGLFFKSFSL